ncbi:MAG: hypothetical protein IJV72_07990 [Clostridia bacterium]|nr:hypothetical protein [Clostridia bacterium]
MSVIFKREFRSYFQNVTGFVFIAVYILIAGAFITLYNFFSFNSSISYAVSDLMLWGAPLIPILTMNVIAKDRKSGAYQLLYSLPLRSSDIILGKYFAMLVVFAIPTAFLALMPLIFNFMGEVNYLVSYTSIICFFLFGAALIAVCTFVSSLSDNVILSAVFNYITVAALIALYMVKPLIALLPAGEIITKILSVFDIFGKFESFVYGIFDIKAIIYYLSVSALFVFLSVRLFERKRLM